ncbi:MAG: hypothetical protein A3G24_14545 [Betaproteobacteria bacterium RIFCSPLOWO2_12_FULL_62_13]|nr:MAG: hypothetical protein A3G24_14545 [Betaproteobacteria bacterium RIFCSPLOWO2_12_FULL_62_13]
MRPAVEAEKLGIPSVVITNSGFASLARITAKAAGVSDLRVAEYPGALGIDNPDQIRQRITEVLFNNIIDGLTVQPAPGAAAFSAGRWDPAKIVFTGSPKQVDRFFAEQDWTDGLPVVPPTTERVEQFLRFVNCAPDEEIAVLPPSNRKAVPWTIAVNAVMAGCEPYHMPIIMAAVRALADPRFNINNMGSTSGLLPFVLLNGPIVKELDFASGAQLISRGSNPVIGRAVGLIFKNIAGFVSGKNYMGTFGYPLVFTLAEDEEGSPWESFHVEHGFPRDASTVTLGVTNNWGPAPSPTSTPEKSGAQVTLEVICKELVKKKRLYTFPGRGPHAEKAIITVLVSATLAKSLAAAGYSKHAVKEYLYEHTRMPLREFEWVTRYTTAKERSTPREKAAAGVFPPEYAGAPDDMVRLLSGPDIVHIVVCGDPNRNRLMTLEGGHADPTTAEVELPHNWPELLEQAL